MRMIAALALIFMAPSIADATELVQLYDDDTQCEVLVSVAKDRVAVDILLLGAFISTIWQDAEDSAVSRGGSRVLPKFMTPELTKMFRAVQTVCEKKPKETIHDVAEAVFTAYYLTARR